MIKLNLRLILIFLEISIIPLFLISYLALYHTKKMVTEGTLSQLEQVVAVNQSRLEIVLSENDGIVDRLFLGVDTKQASAGSVLKNKIEREDLEKILDEEKVNIGGVEDIFLFDSSGKILNSSGTFKSGQTYPYLKALLAGRDKGRSTSQKFTLDYEGALKLIAFKMVSDGTNGVFAGVQRNGEYVLSVFENYIGFGNSFEFLLVDRDKYGNVIFVNPTRFDQARPYSKTTPGDDFNQSTTMALSGQEKKVEDSVDWRGKHVLSVTRNINETGWGLVAKKDQDETYLPVVKLSSLLAVIAVVAVVIIVLISLSAAASIVAPIKRLIGVTTKISGGDLSQRAVVESKDEIGLLELSFNEMASKLKDSYGTLENKVAERTSELEVIRKNLEVANLNLRELDKLKDEFVSVASHELRTPMTAINGLISMIFEGDYGKVNEGLKEPLQNISTSTQRLIALVNDMLNVSRIEAGRVKVVLSEFDIKPVISEMVEQLMPIAIEKGLSLNFIPSKDKSVVQADKDKIREILNNLIGNALKFTQAGEVTLSVSSNADEVKVLIKDSGYGIAQDDQARLFGKFKQITSQQIGKPSGSGLGLYISRELARKMGGDLWIDESKPGKGSVFAFSVPASGSGMAKMTLEKTEKENTPLRSKEELMDKIAEKKNLS